MNKIFLTISSAFMLGGILTGCGMNEDAIGEGDTSTVPLIVSYNDTGSHTNNNYGAFTRINDRGFNDQYMFNQNRNYDNRTGNQNGAFSQRGNYGYGDYNYHGHLNTTYNGVPTKSYNTGHEHVIAQKITDRLEHEVGVNDVAAFIDGELVVVVLDINNDGDQNVEKNVRRIAERMANGKKVKVITDKGMFDRVKDNMNTF